MSYLQSIIERLRHLTEKKAEPFVIDVEKAAEDNEYFRKVLNTSERDQLVVMSLKPNENIGMEIHPGTDQFIRVEQGNGVASLNGKDYPIKAGSAILIPAGTKHDITNTSGRSALKLYTLYSPPHHRDGAIHKTKADAEADKDDVPPGGEEEPDIK